MSTQLKFQDPYVTAKGETRASVELRELRTLWFNTGTRCNLSCDNCYIESNPKNDRLSFLTTEDLIPYLDEITTEGLKTKEIGFTGGEPFLNPHIIELLEEPLKRGFQTLLLTNAFRIERYKKDLVRLNQKYGPLLTIRISLDHYTSEIHEKERGAGTFLPTLKNVQWMFQEGISIAIAGRTLTGEDKIKSYQGYAQMLKEFEIDLDTNDSQQLVIFAEMDPKGDPPEITTACWDILNKSPDEMMCSNSRMVVKRKGEDQAKVLACTLLAYDPQFEMGTTLKNSKKSVQLNHKFCAQFCVLGGSSCS
jgi:sulfatase maturation enzyme AslB (radical SAM superfamily)